MSRWLLPLIRESLALAVARVEARTAVRRLVASLAAYALAFLFAAASFAFLNVELYLLIADRLDAERAAAILFGGNLAVAGLILLAHATGRSRQRAKGHGAASSLAGLVGPDLEAVVALGRRAEKELRAAAPRLVVGAAVIGLLVGRFPEILRIFEDRRPGGRDG